MSTQAGLVDSILELVATASLNQTRLYALAAMLRDNLDERLDITDMEDPDEYVCYHVAESMADMLADNNELVKAKTLLESLRDVLNVLNPPSNVHELPVHAGEEH